MPGATPIPRSTRSLAACVAIVATGLVYLLMLGTPQPHLFFSWIMALVTLAAVVYPFSTGAPVAQKAATAIVNLVIGIAITSLLSAVAARAIRRVGPPSGAVRQQREYTRQTEYAPTEPIDLPRSRTPGHWN